MSAPRGWAAGLAFLPQWLADTTPPPDLDTSLAGWVRATGWRAGGVFWPADAPTLVVRVGTPGRDQASPDAAGLRELRAGRPTADWFGGGVGTLLSPTGRQPGVLWADTGNDDWSDAEREYLRLSAALIARSPALAARIGPVLDPERLNQRLGDAAVIAGRMAHDFDNILTGIIGFSDLAAPLLAAGSQPAKFVAEIGKVGHRGIVFTQQLHQLSRSGQARPQPGSVAAAVAKETARLRPVFRPGVRVQTDVPLDLAAVAMDAGPLGVVVGHLLENAAEATPADGRIDVTGRVLDLTAADAAGFLGAVGPGPHAELAVADTGPGVPPDARGRLFADPFVTTKVRHRGLGLAVVYRTLYAHRGGVRIEAAPPPGPGTVARIVVPLAPGRRDRV